MGTVKYTGSVASFHCPANAEIRSLKVHFSPKQEGSGDPSPENVRPIVGWDGVSVEQSGENQTSTTNYEFGVLGKNKFDKSTEIVNAQYVSGTGKYEEKSIRIMTDFIPIVPHVNYTISIDSQNIENFALINYNLFDENKNWLGDRLVNGETISFNGEKTHTFNATFNNAHYVRIVIRDATDSNKDISNKTLENAELQLELGSTATAYEPYDSNHTVYGGWVDLITGEVCETVEAKNASSLTWIQNDSFTSTFDGIGWTTRRIQFDANDECYCDYYTWYKSTTVGTKENGIAIANTSNASNRYKIYIRDIRYELVEDFINSFQTYDPLIIVPLATSNTYHLAPTELQTFLGHNNVWSNADYVEVEYDLHETQDILNRKNFIIANQPHIVRPAAAPLQNFTTDVPAPLKECKVHFAPVQDLNGYDKPWPAGGGKNLFDASQIGSSTSEAFITLQLVADTTYTFSSNKPSDAGDFSIQTTNTDLEAEGAVYDSHPITFTALNDASISIRYYNGSDTSLSDYWYQLEKGSAATSYVPYENVCPISGWTGIEVMRSPKNIFPKSLPEQLVKGSWGTDSTSISSATYARCFSIYIGTNRTLKFAKTDILTMELAFTDSPILDRSNALYSAVNCTNRSTYTFRSNEHPYLGIAIANVSLWGTLEERKCILRFDETPEGFEARVDWEPIPIDWTDSAGTIYGGYVDLVTGEVVQTCYNMLVDASTAIYSSNLTHGVLRVIYELPYTGADKNALMCNKFGLRARNSAMYNYPTKGLIALGAHNAATTSLQIGAPNGITTQAEWESWLTDNSPIQVIYELNEPIRYPIDPITLKTFRGTNNIWSTANGNIDLAYWRH